MKLKDIVAKEIKKIGKEKTRNAMKETMASRVIEEKHMAELSKVAAVLLQAYDDTSKASDFKMQLFLLSAFSFAFTKGYEAAVKEMVKNEQTN